MGRNAVWVVAVVTIVWVVASSGAALRTAPLLVRDVGGAQAGAVAIGDVTGEGRTDVVLTTNRAETDSRLWVFAQEPDGTLAAPMSYETAGGFSEELDSVAIGDVTGDGRSDVVLGIREVGVQVFPQLASGSLGTPKLSPTEDGRLVRLGHLDGDDRLDVGALGFGTDTVSVLLNDGNGALRPAIEYGVLHRGFEDLEVADVTGDGRDDLVVMSGQSNEAPDLNVLAQRPDGGFEAPSTRRLQSRTLAEGLGVGDVTGDGRTDVVVSYGGNSPRFAVYGQTAAGTLAAPVDVESNFISGEVEVGDLNLDARSDVIVFHGGFRAAGFLIQREDGTLASESWFKAPYDETDAHGLAIGDINGDGSPDLVMALRHTGLVVRYLKPRS